MNWKIYISGIIVSLLVWNILAAQYRFEKSLKYGFEEGLPEKGKLIDIAQDENGFIWLATLKGLARLDGTQMKIFQTADSLGIDLPSDLVFDLFFDREYHKLYIATHKGLTILNTLTMDAQIFEQGNASGQIPPGGIRRVFLDRKGTLWLGHAKAGLLYFDKSKDSFFHLEASDMDQESERLLKTSEIFNYDFDTKDVDVLWLASNNGILKVNTKNKTVSQFLFPAKTDLELLYANLPHSLFATKDALYFGTWYAGVYKLDFKTGHINRLNIFKDADQRFIKSFYPDKEGKFWINTSLGTVLYDPVKSRKVEVYNNDKKLLQFYSVDLMDKDGGCWTIQPDLGLYYFPPVLQQFKYINYYDGPQHTLPFTWDYLEDTINQKSYLCTQAGPGIYQFDKDGNQPIIIGRQNEGPHSFSSRGLYQLSTSEILVTIKDKILTIDKRGKFLIPFKFQIPVTTAYFRQMIEDDKGWLWVTSRYEGVFRMNLQTGEVQHYKEEIATTKGMVNSYVTRELFKDKEGNIWISNWTGFCRWNAKTDKFKNFTLYDQEGNINYGNAGGFDQDRYGRIWIAADDLYYFDPDDMEQLKKVDPKLFKNTKLSKVRSHDNGTLWLLGDKGLESFNPDDQSTVFFNFNYFKNNFLTSLKKLTSGQMVLLDQARITFFNPDALFKHKSLPKPYITTFKIFDELFQMDSVLFDSKTIQLNHKENFFTIEFSAIDFVMPNNTVFQYRLEGFDKKWNNAGKRRYVSYTNVPGGEYDFELRVINDKGLTSSESFQLKICISTPFWKTTWFYILMGLSVVGISRWFSWQRIKRIRKEELTRREFEQKLAEVEMSALRAQMNPHFIFNSLNSIDNYILRNKTEEASDYLNRFSILIRKILQNSRSKYISLEAELECLRLYIEMESLRYNHRFEYRVSLQAGLDTEAIEIPPMLIQPYVENAIWHGLMQKKGKGRLEIIITREGKNLKCVIEDDGIGREAARSLRSKTGSVHKSYGMKITSDRLNLINRLYDADAKVKVLDLMHPDGSAKGTRVELVVPL